MTADLITKVMKKSKKRNNGTSFGVLHNHVYICLCLKVYWFKDGKQISKRSEHYRISRDPDGTCSLHTAAASLDDDGNYTIMAGNPVVRYNMGKIHSN